MEEFADMVDVEPATALGVCEPGAAGARQALTGSDGWTEAIEEIVGGVWCELLARDVIGPDQDLGEPGGGSAVAVRAAALLGEVFGVDLARCALGAGATVGSVAARIVAALRDAAGEPLPRLQPALRDRPLPASAAQQRLWMLAQLDRGGPACNAAVALALRGPLALPALAGALAELVRRHDGLRATFSMEQEGLVQTVAPAAPAALSVPAVLPVPAALPVVDLSALPHAAGAAEAGRVCRGESRRRFDLTRGPLLRSVLLRSGIADHLLLVVLDRTICDAGSKAVLLGELGDLYNGLRRGCRELLPPPLRVQAADVAWRERLWLAGDAAAGHRAFWRRQLAGLPTVLDLPFDRPRPAARRWHRGAARPVVLAAPAVAGIRRLARRQQAASCMVWLAAFQVLLARYAGQDDVAVGVPTAGRGDADVARLIGVFDNTLAVRTRLGATSTFEQVVAGARQAVVAAFAHRDLPFAQVIQAVQPRRSLRHAPLCQVRFALQSVAPVAPALSGLAVRAVGMDDPTGARQREHHHDSDSEAVCHDGYDLGWTLGAQADGCGWLSFDADLFDAATIGRLAHHLAVLVEGAVAAPATGWRDLPLLAPAELHQLRHAWNDTERRPLPAPAGVFERFRVQAAADPGRVALEWAGERLTYQELNRRAAAAAAALCARGAGPGGLAAIFLERSAWLAAAFLGALAAGCAWVVLDPDHPPERQRLLVAEARPRWLLTTRDLIARGPTAAGEPIVLDDLELAGEAAKIARAAAAAATTAAATTTASTTTASTTTAAITTPATTTAATTPAATTLSATTTAAGPTDLAYLVYTSGSTGSPKGVLTPRGGVESYLAYLRDAWGLGAADVVLQLAAPTFDASVRDLLGPLTAGGRVVLPTAEQARDPRALIALLAASRATCLLSVVPTLLASLLDAAESTGVICRSVRLILVSGERFPAPLAARARAVFGAGVRLVNQFGPTECTMTSTFHRLAAAMPGDGGGQVAIGFPIPNARVHVLDAALRLQPIGVTGGIHIGGAGLAWGYLAKPDATAERFLPDPFAVEPGSRLYATGDLGRRRADGTLDFLGRTDQQLKLRGVRVEPGEIEAVLASHPLVSRAAVVARDGGQRLVAFAVLASGPANAVTAGGAVATAIASSAAAAVRDPAAAGAAGTAGTAAVVAGALREHLRARLPESMVPAPIVILDTLPLTATGKVDRRALPDPDDFGLDPDDAERDPASGGAQAPRSPLELRLVRIWEDLLAVRPIGIADDFFDLGGDSQLAVRLVAELRRQLGRDLPLAALFAGPTVERLAWHLDESAAPLSSSSAAPLVLLQPHGAGPPLFCVHPAGGNVRCYVDLAYHLGEDRRVFALEMPGPGPGSAGLGSAGISPTGAVGAMGAAAAAGTAGAAGNGAPPESVEEMAARYVAAVRAAQPAGPHRLAGWSFGGLVALEMARQLRAAGGEVAWLWLFDTVRQRDGWAPDDEEELLACALGEDLGSEPDAMRAHAATGTAELEAWLAERYRQAALVPPGFGAAQAHAYLARRRAHAHAANRYRPRPYGGRITLFWARDRPGREPHDAWREWEELAAGDLEVIEVPGRHETILRRPAVATVAGLLRQRLKRSDGLDQADRQDCPDRQNRQHGLERLGRQNPS